MSKDRVAGPGPAAHWPIALDTGGYEHARSARHYMSASWCSTANASSISDWTPTARTTRQPDAYPATVAGRTRSRPVPGWQPRYSKC
jgi:hypothetical protein